LDVEGGFMASSFAGCNSDIFLSCEDLNAISPRTLENIVERVQVDACTFMATY
jgi:hypothetical protein